MEFLSSIRLSLELASSSSTQSAGVTIAGFYYCSLRRDDGIIEGIDALQPHPNDQVCIGIRQMALIRQSVSNLSPERTTVGMAGVSQSMNFDDMPGYCK